MAEPSLLGRYRAASMRRPARAALWAGVGTLTVTMTLAAVAMVIESSLVGSLPYLVPTVVASSAASSGVFYASLNWGTAETRRAPRRRALYAALFFLPLLLLPLSLATSAVMSHRSAVSPKLAEAVEADCAASASTCVETERSGQRLREVFLERERTLWLAAAVALAIWFVFVAGAALIAATTTPRPRTVAD